MFLQILTGLLPTCTHVRHTWQLTHTQTASPPWHWSPRTGTRLGHHSPTVHPRRAEARCRVPGPRQAEKGAVITRPQGAPHTSAFHPGPRPSPTQTLITASRPVISSGRGRTWQGVGGRGAPHRLHSNTQEPSSVPARNYRLSELAFKGYRWHPASLGFIKVSWDSRRPQWEHTMDPTGEFLAKCTAMTRGSEPRAWSPAILISCTGKPPASWARRF